MNRTTFSAAFGAPTLRRKRTSGAEALVRPAGCGTAEALPFVQRGFPWPLVAASPEAWVFSGRKRSVQVAAAVDSTRNKRVTRFQYSKRVNDDIFAHGQAAASGAGSRLLMTKGRAAHTSAAATKGRREPHAVV